MPRIPPRIAPLALCAAALSCLTGCAGGSAVYSDLMAAPSDADEIPDFVEEPDALLEVESARHVATDLGNDLWIAEGTEPDTVCVLAVNDEDQNWVIGCTLWGSPLGIGAPGSGTGYILRPDSGSGNDGVAISVNIVRGRM